MREDGRKVNDLRELKIEKDYLKDPIGSVLISMGNTKVICSAFVEEKVPFFLRGKGKGWITAEYGMIPGSTRERKVRDITKGKLDGRTQEIQRLIGRSLRSVLDLEKLGERTIWIDCDVIQADGGTRTAAITGSFVALYDGLRKLEKENILTNIPIKSMLSAVSVGIVDGVPMVDLNYIEDSGADVDMNIVLTEDGEIVEIQGTGETNPFKIKDLTELLELAIEGNKIINKIQKEVLGIE